MKRQPMGIVLLVAAVLAYAPAAWCQQLFAATASGQAGAAATAGNLYAVNLATGESRLVAPLRLADGTPIGLSGLAVHPRSRALYGITSSVSPQPLHLVRVDPTTGVAQVVGDLGHPGSDISFTQEGTLYMWLHQRGQPGVVDLQTGAVKPVGPPQRTLEPGGFAIDKRGQAYVVRGGANGNLDNVDLATAVIRRGPSLTGAPHAAMNTIKFSVAGLLVGASSEVTPPYTSSLVAINVASGNVTPIAPLPDGVDGIAFALPSEGQAPELKLDGDTLGLAILAAIAALLGLIAWDVRRSRRGRQ